MKILEIKDLITPQLMSIPGVVGVGISTIRNAIRVYVEKLTTELKAKIPLEVEKLTTELKIPLKIGELKIEIIESGKIYAFQSTTDKWRPAPGGVSIGHFNITAGTLGCVAVDNISRRRVILSNNHVFANCDSIQNSRANKGDAILQPGVYDGGNPADTIAQLEKWVKINETGTNKVDCAIAMPLNDADLSDIVLDIGQIAGVINAAENMEVRKSGRTSGLTRGQIWDTHLTIKVWYEEFIARFTDCFWIGNFDSKGEYQGPFALPGDSGSAITDKNGKNIVGLLFAGAAASGEGIACKIGNIINSLNISFPAPPSIINVNSIPNEADIYLDGFIVGKTNNSFKISSGTHNLKVRKWGYFDYTETFVISAGQTKNFNPTLIVRAIININSTPWTGANIYLDGNYLGKTNSSHIIQDGTYDLKVTYPGCHDYTETFSINERETKNFNITLIPLAAINVINPTGASIYLNSSVTDTPYPDEYMGTGVYGEPDYLGNTDIFIPIRPTGYISWSIKNFEYILTAIKKGYQIYKEKFTLSAGETKTFSITLTPLLPGNETIDQESVSSEAKTNGENCRRLEWSDPPIEQTFKPSLPTLTKIELRCREICGNCGQNLYLFKGNSNTPIAKIGFIPPTTQGGGVRFSPVWAEIKFATPIAVEPETEYKFRIVTNIFFWGGPLISYDNPYLRGRCSDAPEADLKFRTYGIIPAPDVRFEKVTYTTLQSANETATISATIKNYGDNITTKLDLVNRDTNQIISTYSYFLKKGYTNSKSFKLTMPYSTQLPSRILKIKLNLYEGDYLKDYKNMDIILNEGKGDFVLAEYPTTAKYKYSTKIYVTMANIGAYSDKIFFNIIDNDTNMALATTYSTTLNAGKSYRTYRNIKMPNKNLNFRIEVGHKEGSIYIIDEVSPVYTITKI